MTSEAKSPPRFLTAEWVNLLMLNYEIEPAALVPYVPRGVELDTWLGRSFVSVVGFLFRDVRLRGVPVPCHRSFEEVNLRFYVYREAPEGIRRGVTFIKEIVPRRAVALVARRVYNENYHAHPMRHELSLPSPEGDGSVAYEWRAAGRWNRMSARFCGACAPLEPGSEPEFIAEHYWGYGRARDGGTWEYRVDHPRWNVWPAEDPRLNCDVARIYGPAFAEALSRPPCSAFVADGSAVAVYRGVKLV